jgi:Ser/Thr protein kinase RdoA (MazF antagonist)
LLTGSFENLSPAIAMQGVEESFGCVLDGTMESYASYVNRVYGLRTETGERLVVKFYRPGRWSREAIEEEHRFLLDCAETEIPVIAPMAGPDGATLHSLVALGENGGQELLFALFKRTGGRTFEPESEEDLIRLGSLLGRCHAAGARREAPHRVACTPSALTAAFVEELLGDGLVHPACAEEFRTLCAETLTRVTPRFEGVPLQRIHGDCHRGNIIDRPDTGLVLIDFDDMMRGPAVQDLWLVLPDHAEKSRAELGWLLEGYERFREFDRTTVRLIEPLRFMRMIYFLAWRARQRNDFWFRESFPTWGNEAFWIKELSDLRDQAEMVNEALDA